MIYQLWLVARHSILLKREAIKLIVAFKEFIASVSSGVATKKSPKKGTVITVGLHEQGMCRLILIEQTFISLPSIVLGGSRSESNDEVSKVTHIPAPKSIYSLLQF